MSVMFESEGDRAPFSLPVQRDTHKGGAAKSRYKTKRLFDPAFLTSDSYQDSLVFDMRMFSRVLIHIREVGGVNAIKYNVLACLDPSMWRTLRSDQVVNAGTDVIETLSDAWNWVRLQVASNVSGNAGRVNVFVTGKTP